MPFHRMLGFFLSIGFLIFAPSPTQAQRGGTLGERGTPGCPRAQVGINSVAAELTRISNLQGCRGASRPCRATWSSGPSRDLPGIWLGNATHVFTISEQDGIIAQARAGMASIAPPAMQLIGLTFTEDLYGPAGPPKGLRISARADYGICGRNRH